MVPRQSHDSHTTARRLRLRALRQTWRTAGGRRAGVDGRTAKELGGWSRGAGAEVGYDHGLELTRYLREQEKIAKWLRKNGYID